MMLLLLKRSAQVSGAWLAFLASVVLLRGLLAYYQEDDVRALENWQRLHPERLPFRLAALKYCSPSIQSTAPSAVPCRMRNGVVIFCTLKMGDWLS